MKTKSMALKSGIENAEHEIPFQTLIIISTVFRNQANTTCTHRQPSPNIDHCYRRRGYAFTHHLTISLILCYWIPNQEMADSKESALPVEDFAVI
jgi:hypothetical protein